MRSAEINDMLHIRVVWHLIVAVKSCNMWTARKYYLK